MKRTDDIIKVGFETFKDNPKIFLKAYKVSAYNDEPTFFQYNIVFKDKNSNKSSPAIATGTSFSQIHAFRKAFGEMVERYSLSAMDQSVLRKKSYSPNSAMLSPNKFISFLPDLQRKLGISKDTLKTAKFSWINCKDIYTSKDYLIPAQLVYVPYKYQNEEPTLQASNSSGAACGMSLEDAIYRGICELIERDAFLNTYLRKLNCKLANINSIKNVQLQKMIKRITRHNLEIYLVITTTDIPVFSLCAIILDKTGLGPAVSVGLKAGLNKKDVMIGALEEALMTRSWARDNFEKYSKRKHYLKQEIKTIEDRAHYWFSTKMITHLDFWLKTGKLIDISIKKSNDRKRNNFKTLLKILKERKIECYFVDVTSKLLNKHKVFVVKAISPSLIPMYLDENYPNFENEKLNRKRINQIPHPFL